MEDEEAPQEQVLTYRPVWCRVVLHAPVVLMVTHVLGTDISRVRFSAGALVDSFKFGWYNGSMAYTGEQKREYQRQWVAARRAEYFDGKACVVCGSTENLELDHINPDDKKYSPAALWSMAKNNPNRIAELEKCQTLCSFHHKEKTRLWRAEQAQHGRTLYDKGCRCEVCMEAKRLHNAQRYAS